ncbi:hypothetical protein TNCV_2104111 [Trichonephila clavipes]|nr:hypothetical protein TNCV_2104111 [Trichonephila clavipes]
MAPHTITPAVGAVFRCKAKAYIISAHTAIFLSLVSKRGNQGDELINHNGAEAVSRCSQCSFRGRKPLTKGEQMLRSYRRGRPFFKWGRTFWISTEKSLFLSMVSRENGNVHEGSQQHSVEFAGELEGGALVVLTTILPEWAEIFIYLFRKRWENGSEVNTEKEAR